MRAGTFRQRGGETDSGLIMAQRAPNKIAAPRYTLIQILLCSIGSRRGQERTSAQTSAVKSAGARLVGGCRARPAIQTAPALAARLCGVAAAPRLADELPTEGAIGLTGG